MIWLWEREGQRLTYEVRRLGENVGYELTVTYPDGSEESERFEDPTALIERSFAWKDRLSGQGWRPVPPW